MDVGTRIEYGNECTGNEDRENETYINHEVIELVTDDPAFL